MISAMYTYRSLVMMLSASSSSSFSAALMSSSMWAMTVGSIFS